jgi:hypothetical protein
MRNPTLGVVVSRSHSTCPAPPPMTGVARSLCRLKDAGGTTIESRPSDRLPVCPRREGVTAPLHLLHTLVRTPKDRCKLAYAAGLRHQ